jgi:hypothetical protein
MRFQHEARVAGGGPQPIPSIRDHNWAVPSALEAVIRRALAFDPTERFPHADVFVNAFHAAAQGIFRTAPLSASPPGVGREERCRRRSPQMHSAHL